MNASSTSRSFWRAFGPGLLFAGAAVGVSHLVQSTRAGATYGFGLVLFVVLANAAKYPAFRFGPHYAAATGTSLLEGYRRQGRWALWLYALATVGTMFTVQAAVTLVTAGLAIALLGLDASPVLVSSLLVIGAAGVIALGRYHWLDRVNKLVVAVLTVSTLVATVAALPRIDWSHMPLWPSGGFDTATAVAVAGLVGWMPSAIDVSVWHSLWTLARGHDTGHAPSLAESTLDFHIGYLGTAILALCFVTLGAAVMYGSGTAFAPTAGGFAHQVISLYTASLGEWSRPVIGVAAFSVMLSTTLTVVDGFPRALSVLYLRLGGAEQAGVAEEQSRAGRRVYWLAMAVLAVGSLLIIARFLAKLGTLVDLATTLSFLTAPLLSILNHRAVLGAEVPAAARPGRGLVAASLLGILFQVAVALVYLWLRFG